MIARALRRLASLLESLAIEQSPDYNPEPPQDVPWVHWKGVKEWSDGSLYRGAWRVPGSRVWQFVAFEVET